MKVNETPFNRSQVQKWSLTTARARAAISHLTMERTSDQVREETAVTASPLFQKQPASYSLNASRQPQRDRPTECFYSLVGKVNSLLKQQLLPVSTIPYSPTGGTAHCRALASTTTFQTGFTYQLTNHQSLHQASLVRKGNFQSLKPDNQNDRRRWYDVVFLPDSPETKGGSCIFLKIMFCALNHANPSSLLSV